MALPGFFKKPEYKRFNIQPRYWDPAKEEREERENRIKAELGMTDDNDQYIPNIKGQIRRSLRHKSADVRQTNKKSNIRLFIILFLLLFIAYAYVFGFDLSILKM
ncbi:hypothetical protein [Ancylomarina sp. 16SWW S1-10-2]|uniref:hypothetical protein n=1 Tax=Ancylomarina sp. 16SWW S1-10-2 TaxID=2499681 RepID=UPI0012ADE644|nr:hypothetical protein [Ancylomarina sp. 16SWW S1-10-2]MRT92193.1 hypothetical protein [Ancylomarina sp. 16SWW S1-10-2]